VSSKKLKDSSGHSEASLDAVLALLLALKVFYCGQPQLKKVRAEVCT
jgi:hypothetical protein